MIAEAKRLAEDAARTANWKRWGPYLAERQWATVREDYSPDGACWDYFPHDHSRSRAYRWGEDGLLGITDRECRLCFALALWNERDPILKERLFGLTGSEGNHGEDVKEEYFYLDSTPTHSYMKALYRYPQAEFPYARLVESNRRRGLEAPEFELADAGVFEQNRAFDVVAEYANLNDACVGVGHHRACLGGAMTDSKNVRPPVSSVPSGAASRAEAAPDGTETGFGRVSCCQSWPHRHKAGGGLAARQRVHA